MKISNIKNLETALKEQQKEIEIYGDISNTVLKSGLVSNIIFICVVTLFIGIVLSVSFGLTYLFTNIYWTMAVAIISICVIIFSLTILLTLKVMQKISIRLSIKIRNYTINKKKGKVVLIRK